MNHYFLIDSEGNFTEHKNTLMVIGIENKDDDDDENAEVYGAELL